MTYVLGVDIGGTFTDAFGCDDEGRAFSAKAPSTPGDFATGMIDSLTELANTIGRPISELLSETAYICHGTTSTLNALVTGNVARIGYLCTQGHADSIRIQNAEGRHTGLSAEEKQNLSQTDKPQPLVHHSLVRELHERVDHSGSVIIALDEDHTRKVVQELIDAGVEAIAVSLLWSFINPQHEQTVERIIGELAPDMHVGLSSQLSPRIREYSRSVTTIMSTQVAPRLRAYLDPLTDRLTSLGFSGSLLLMQGSGGAVTAAEAPNQAITTVGSVLTGGIAGCVRLGALLDHPNVISTDMGGTTFLTGLVVDGAPVVSPTMLLGQYRVNTPMVDVTAIGSGGGAIAWLDHGNLRVGPDSAGASPGPACFGEGGTRPTITDANLVLGLLDANQFLGGRKQLHLDLAREALLRDVGGPLGLNAEEAAAAVYAIANSQTADLVRRVVVGAGHDPRDFVVYAYGGSGPVHCASYAADLGVREVVVPLGTTASAFSAYGLAATDVVLAAESSRPSTFPLDVDQVAAEFAALETTLADNLSRQNIEFASVTTRREVDVRYSMQLAELATPVGAGVIDERTVADIAGEFEAQYARLFGAEAGYRDAGLQAISYRAFVTGELPLRPQLPEAPTRASEELRPRSHRRVWQIARLGWQEAAIYHYADLYAEDQINGPAVIEASTTTVSIPEGVLGTVDRYGNLRLTFETVGQSNASVLSGNTTGGQ
ncbi:hydantoinase/oxoprolinase family protein [Nocardioides sp. 1609]|uniref:hydantoinase/oxoprolinase family protein n=1 Tax=Nocardioides sp. 1609 TaxID=2508327 RepID=UPI00107016E1|nr:hydantoinase/oxoprolinase family protein [Nocardioides sp. 1609]